MLPLPLFDFRDGRPVPYGVDDDFCCFSDSRKGCPYDLFFQFVADDAHIVQKSYVSLFACGESVRRGRRTLRIYRDFVRFQVGEHSSPLPC